MRASSAVHIWVDVPEAIRGGVPFYRSANGVILTPGHAADGNGPELLPIRFVTRIVEAHTGHEWDFAAAQFAAPTAS